MARKTGTLEYSTEQTHHEDEHPDEQAAGKQATNYPGANQREDWSRNEIQENLMEQLDGQARAALKYNHNLADYDTGDRKNIVNSVAEGFNSLEFTSDKERHEAAQETAATVFKPFYREIDIQELQGNPNFSPGALKALEAEGVKQVRYNASEDGLDNKHIHEIYLKVDDMEAAQRIIDRSGGMASIISREKLEESEKDFASTLYATKPGDHDGYARLLEIINEAVEYTKPGPIQDAAAQEWLKQQEEQPGTQEETTWERIKRSLKEKFEDHTAEQAATDANLVSLKIAAQDQSEAPIDFRELDQARNFNPTEHVTRFDKQDFADDQERLEAAQESAREHFQDLHAGARYLEPLTGDQLRSRDLEEYTNFTPSHERLDEYQEQFAHALASNETKQYEKAGILSEVDREARAYMQGKLWGDEMRHLSFQDASDLRDLPTSLRAVMEDHVEANWYTAQEAIGDMQKDLPEDADTKHLSGAIHATTALRNTYTHALTEAVRTGDEDRFNLVDDSFNSHSFAHALRENTGFVTADEHQPPELRNEFSIPFEAQLYFRSVDRALRELDEGIDPFHQEAIRQVIQDSGQYMEWWRHEQDSEQAHELLHVRARAVDYLLQPKRDLVETAAS